MMKRGFRKYLNALRVEVRPWGTLIQLAVEELGKIRRALEDHGAEALRRHGCIVIEDVEAFARALDDGLGAFDWGSSERIRAQVVDWTSSSGRAGGVFMLARFSSCVHFTASGALLYPPATVSVHDTRSSNPTG